MITSNNILLAIENNNLNTKELVSILEITASKLQINTISETARLEGKTHRGILTSNCYRKLMIGDKKMAIIGLRDTNLPF